MSGIFGTRSRTARSMNVGITKAGLVPPVQIEKQVRTANERRSG
jgi:hypothetical protein